MPTDSIKISSNASLPANNPSFDPEKHLDYAPPSNTVIMEDLRIKGNAISPIASTEPFSLLSQEAVLQHRRELFSPEVLKNCLYHTRPGSVQLRGMAPRYAPFIHQFWNSPEVLKILSENAGVDLVPVMDYEICHTNVQLGPTGIDGVLETPIIPPEASNEAIAEFQKAGAKPDVWTNQEKPIIEWHEDSYVFVCVVMLSDARYMVGGETEIMGGNGKTLKVKSPQMVWVYSARHSPCTLDNLFLKQGCAVLLQGRHIMHTAAPAANMPERITIVTSFRPRDPMLIDESTNEDIRNKSLLPELYYQWTTYRLDVLSARTRTMAERLRGKYKDAIQESDAENKIGHCRREVVNFPDISSFVEDVIAYAQHTVHAMRPFDQNGR